MYNFFAKEKPGSIEWSHTSRSLLLFNENDDTSSSFFFCCCSSPFFSPVLSFFSSLYWIHVMRTNVDENTQKRQRSNQKIWNMIFFSPSLSLFCPTFSFVVAFYLLFWRLMNSKEEEEALSITSRQENSLSLSIVHSFSLFNKANCICDRDPFFVLYQVMNSHGTHVLFYSKQLNIKQQYKKDSTILCVCIYIHEISGKHWFVCDNNALNKVNNLIANKSIVCDLVFFSPDHLTARHRFVFFFLLCTYKRKNRRRRKKKE